MKRTIVLASIALLTLLLAGLAVGPEQAMAQGKGQGKGHGKGNGNGNGNGSATPSAAQIRFAPGDVRVIQEYYGAHPINLPPGLQKKLAQGRPLPPGWQKKLQAFPPAIDTRLGIPCDACGRGVIDGYGIIYDKKTAIILDMIQLAGDILRR